MSFQSFHYLKVSDFYFSHSERKASAAICLTLEFCARGQDSPRDTPMSNPEVIGVKEKAPLYKEGPSKPG